MYVMSAKLTFHIPYAVSLKDKRQVRRSLIDKVRNHRFNVSIAEVDTWDIHRVLTIGIALVSGEADHAKDMLEEAIRYMEGHAAAELVEVGE